VAFHDAMPFDGQLIMTAEYVEGPTLAERLSHGPLPWREAVRYIGDLLSALEEAHALGIVHRSISPDSIIITAEGTPKLGGFGLAKPMADMKLTQAGSVLGDPRYISPEQVSGLTAIDGRADLYSIGVVLYQALTGRTPFDGRNDFEIMVAQVKEQPSAPSASGQDVPLELDRIVLKSMAKDPANRFQGAREFREALEIAAGTLPQAADHGIPKAAPALLPAGLQTRPAWHSRKSILVGVASAVVAFVIIIVLVMYKS
jgi:serine/threonine-protein kinase